MIEWLFEKVVTNHIINTKVFSVLSAVAEQRNLCINRLSRECKTTYVFTIRIINLLSEKGFIVKQKSDKKSVIATLTPKGEEILKELRGIKENTDDN